MRSEMNDAIEEAVEVLKKGGIILYPTDTVWGIGCDATNSEAVARVYELKRSANKKGMIVLVDSADRAARYTNKAPAVAWELFECADRPLTLILPGAVGVAPNLIPEEGSLAIRIPDHEFCRRLVVRLRAPLVSTSANVSGHPTPEGYGDIEQEIVDGVDYAVDRKWEGVPTGKASSIIALGENGEVKIVRK